MERVAKMRLIISILFVLLCAVHSFAADLPNSGRLLRESAPPPSLTPQQQAPVFKLPEQKSAPVEPGGVRVLVAGFRFSGNKAISSTELATVVSGYVSRELTLAELYGAADEITRYYRSKGYFLAKGSIPAQTLKSGEPVRIEIVEGELEQLKIETAPRSTRVPLWLLQGLSEKIALGRAVDDATLTETSMLINELPAISSRIVLEPGEKPGGTRAVIEVQEGKLWGLSLDADNAGSYGTGYYRTGASLELYSPLHLGDRLDLRFQTSTTADTQNLRLGYAVPLGSSGVRADLSYSWVGYHLGRSYESLDANGMAHDIGLTINLPFIRSRALVLNGTIGMAGKMLEDRLDAYQQLNKRHSIAGQLGMNGYLVDDLLGSDASSFFSLQYTAGSLGFDDQATEDADQHSTMGLQTRDGYSKLSYSLGRTQNLTAGFSLYAGLNGQWVDKNLDSSEQFSLGGPNAVRAYPVGEASADWGMLTTAELRYLLSKLGPLPGTIQLSGFVDYGYARIDALPLNGDQGNTRYLSGAGFAVNWFNAGDFLAKTSVAWRISDPPTSDNTAGTKPTVYFQLIKRF